MVNAGSGGRNFNGWIYIGEIAMVITVQQIKKKSTKINSLQMYFSKSKWMMHVPQLSYHRGSLFDIPHWLNNIKINWLILSLVYGFGYEIIAVMSVTTITSVTGYWPSLLDLRKRHQYKLPLMNSVPTIPWRRWEKWSGRKKEKLLIKRWPIK